MNSLRFRLIVGAALIAVVPLVAAMLLFSGHIESAVRDQASEHLSAALGQLRAQLIGDGRRIAERIEILAADPTLRRTYLVREGSRDLAEYLEERRILLGLDFLQVSDTAGTVVADASSSPSAAANAEGEPLRLEPGGPAAFDSLTIQRVQGAAAMAMTAGAPIRYEGQTAGFLRGGVAFDRNFLGRLEQTSGLALILGDSNGRAIATTLGDSGVAALPARAGIERVTLAGRHYLSRSIDLEVGAPPHPRIAGLVPMSSVERTIRSLQVTSALLAALGLAIAILLGSLWSSQISRPVEQLAAYSDRLARGEWDAPLALRSVRELETLVGSLDRMRTDLVSYRERLVTSERQAAWSQMARKVAHEIKNPLTPIAVSVADLKRSYDAKRPDFPQILDQAVRTVGEEVEALKRILQEFSDFGRLPAPRPRPSRLGDLIADLETLFGHEVAQGRLAFSARDRDAVFSADAGQLRQALVNLIQNGLDAAGGAGRVTVRAAHAASAVVDGTAERNGTLELAVEDTGPGLTAEQKAGLFVPGFTTKAHGSGLGLTIVERIVNDHRGTIAVDSEPGRGTTFRIHLPMDSGNALQAPRPGGFPSSAPRDRTEA